MERDLRQIAEEITCDWRVINDSAARKALEFMREMGSPRDPFFYDTNGYAVVGSFLEHSRGWRGSTASRIKTELRRMCGHPRP